MSVVVNRCSHARCDIHPGKDTPWILATEKSIIRPDLSLFVGAQWLWWLVAPRRLLKVPHGYVEELAGAGIEYSRHDVGLRGQRGTALSQQGRRQAGLL